MIKDFLKLFYPKEFELVLKLMQILAILFKTIFSFCIILLYYSIIFRALSKHASVFEDQYKRFLSTREQYLGMFDRQVI